MLRRRSIRLRIIVLVLAPVVALVGLYAVVLDLTLGQYLSLRQASAVRKTITAPVMKVQNALAAERGLALEYLRSRDHSRFLRLLLAQEAKTDAAVRQFDAAATSVVQGGVIPREQLAIEVLGSDLAGLGALRTAVVGFGTTVADAAGIYSGKIADGNQALRQAILPVATNAAGLQESDVVTLNASLQAMVEESDVLKADMLVHNFPTDDLQLINQLALQRLDLRDQALPGLDPVYQRYFKEMIPQGPAAAIEAMEAPIGAGAQGAATVSPRAWTTAETAYATGFARALQATENGLAATDNQEAGALFTRLMLAAGLGLLAIGAAIAIAAVLSRRLIRELDDLRSSALTLASEGLPEAIERLRSGDVAEPEEPTLLDQSPDEIGQVRLAFNTAARTAIGAAVEEIKIRRSVNEVFRNLARRNQSLLTRQLELLDAMERRVHDPEELADLFRIDHMTTRMRRHAEGLLIVAGGSSGRTWREPVPLVDVMRAAIAEVENYTRVRVSSRTNAALAGHAVADLIHLLAELVENATMFSPANTPVRVDGDRVARGLALEIEDRGLGMTGAKLAEMNAKLADPPMFDLSGSDQLGLFIAGQLASRHDIKITLRGSPYGGITAVVLIPNSLVVDADADEELGPVSIRELGGRPVPQLPGPSSLASRDMSARGEFPIAPGDPRRTESPVAAVPATTEGQAPALAPTLAFTSDSSPTPAGAPFTDSIPFMHPTPTATPIPEGAPAATSSPGLASTPFTDPTAHDASTPVAISRPATDSLPFLVPPALPPSVPPSAPATYPAPPSAATAPFTGPIPATAQDPGPPAGPAAPARPDVTGPDSTDGPADLPIRQRGMTIGGWPGNGQGAGTVTDADDLPIRVRQASLAPQLRDPSPDHPREQTHPREATETSPEVARNVMAAMQRGWERGRADLANRTEPAQAGPGSRPELGGSSAHRSPEPTEPDEALQEPPYQYPCPPGAQPRRAAVIPGEPTASGGAA